MVKLSPYIFCDNARDQAAFYADALNGEIIDLKTFADMPGASEADKHRVMHLVLKIDEQTIFMADNGEKSVHRGTGMDLTLEFDSEEDGRRAFDHLSHTGKVIMPFERMFWGTMFGRFVDKYGVSWQISAKA